MILNDFNIFKQYYYSDIFRVFPLSFCCFEIKFDQKYHTNPNSTTNIKNPF
ncbi:hypothetical protein J19TS1_43320 [Heyndrickxia oleronia]|nr:hypothetical protein J19TS1_43320 [Heyndrickxia oleronia]